MADCDDRFRFRWPVGRIRGLSVATARPGADWNSRGIYAGSSRPGAAGRHYAATLGAPPCPDPPDKNEKRDGRFPGVGKISTDEKTVWQNRHILVHSLAGGGRALRPCCCGRTTGWRQGAPRGTLVGAPPYDRGAPVGLASHFFSWVVGALSNLRPSHSRHSGRECPVRPNSGRSGARQQSAASCHVWTAPGWQGESSIQSVIGARLHAQAPSTDRRDVKADGTGRRWYLSTWRIAPLGAIAESW